jgi:penicillin-binding protein 1A
MTGKNRKADTSVRNKRRRKPARNSGLRWVYFIGRIVITGFFLLGFLFLAVYFGIFGKIPVETELHQLKTPIASEVFSADGKLLGRYYIENRSHVTFNEISPNVVNALVATEDARFYEHRGIDEIALLRVFFKSVLMMDRQSGGGSTLSQQIAKNLYPRVRLGWFTLPVSKIREGIIAYRLEKIYTKEEILAMYLNTVPFGENIFGIEVAAERFFSKRPSELTVAEAATLVGILKANNLFNPRLHPDRSLQRRNVVIDRMVKQNYLSESEAAKHKEEPLGLRYRLITYNQGPAPYLLGHLRPTLMNWCKYNLKPDGEPYNLFTDGLKIYTTIDFNLQAYARQAVNEHMKQLQEVFDRHWEGRSPWGTNTPVLDRAIRRTERYKSGIAAGKSENEIRQEFEQPIDATLFTWSGLQSVRTTPLDSVKHYLKMLNAGFMAMESNSGQVKAWVGGIDYRFFKYDYVKAPRQVGSTFKPAVYLAALEQGLSPFDYYPNERKIYHDYQDWSPSNASDNYSGYYSMRAALSQSINTVSVDILMKTGISNVIRTAKSLGISSDLPEYPSLALGAASVSLEEMVRMYAAIVNGGVAPEPQILLRIENSRGELLAQFNEPDTEQSRVDPENCKMVVEMLRGVIDEGTARSIRSVYKVPGDFAGKTGTTQDHADGWFIGFTPTLVAGCWVGADDPAIHFRTLTYGQGGYMALPVVGKFFSKLYSDPRYAYMKIQQFDRPDGEVLSEMYAMAPWVENIKPSFDLREIFRRRDSRDTRSDESLRERRPATTDEDKEPVWEKIRRIFRKKEDQ